MFKVDKFKGKQKHVCFHLSVWKSCQQADSYLADKKKYKLSNPCGCCLGFCGMNHDGHYFFKGSVPGQPEVGVQ